MKINRSFGLAISGMRRGVEELGVVTYGSQNVCRLMLGKKLLPLITELIVISNHVGVIH